MLNNLVSSVIKRIRPNYVPDERSTALQVIGWYARKGVIPGIRGLLQFPRFSAAGLPLFLGEGVKISYARSMRLGNGVSLGANTVINAFSDEGIQVGDGVTLRENGWIQCSSSPGNPGVGLSIGANTYIGPGSILGVGGRVTIGADCQIGAGFILVAENHVVGPDGASSSEVIRRGISLGDGCWIGHRVTILDGVTLGEHCVVGAGAVVTRSFPANSKIAGVPARVVASQVADA